MTNIGTRYERGEVLLVPVPFSDLSGSKQRPVLVLSKRPLGQDIIVCAITSNLDNDENSVYIDAEDFVSGSLPRPSRVKVGKLLSMRKSLVYRRYGKVNDRVIAAVRAELLELV